MHLINVNNKININEIIYTITKLLFFSLFIATSTPFKQLTRAQSIPPNLPNRIEETIPQPRQTPLPSKPKPILTPGLELPSIDRRDAPTNPINELINVKQIRIVGNTIFKKRIKEKSIEFFQKYKNCSKQTCLVPFNDLIQLRSSITQLYIDNGYVTSGAFIKNNQFLKTGIVEIQVVEGELERIEINGLNKLQKNYVRSRLRLASKPPINRKRIREALQLLQIDPLLQQVEARLIPGKSPGKSILQLQLQEAAAFNADILVDNNQSPTIGSLQGIISARHNNLLGFGDRLSAEYGLTEGLDIYSLGYAIPVNSRDGKFNIRYSNNDSRIIKGQFDDLNIRSDSETLSFGFRQPLLKKPTTEFALGLTLDVRRSQTTFLEDDVPFPFPDGREDGKSKVTVIRFSQDWLQRNATQVLAARSQFSFGIDAFDATISDSNIDGLFFAWLGQFQWVEQLSPDALILAKINAQFTPDGLLPIEQISIGGVNTVRGYRQNQLLGDNGIVGSVEFRFPLTSDNSLQIRPFFDIGTVWNNQEENLSTDTIAGLGLGLYWQARPDLFLQLDYGIPLLEDDEEGDSLQENGFYFSLRYQAF